jgi:SAM-dependent methyltransferase
MMYRVVAGLVSMATLNEQFGNIDIYLFDQLLRGRIRPGMRILDAGCGDGRNLVYFRREGYDVWGVDASPTLTGWSNFQVAQIENLRFPDAHFDVVISSAVLHFAQDAKHFDAMLHEMWRVLKPGGLFFCRLASNIGMPELQPGTGRLPDGSKRFLVDAETLLNHTAELGGELVDPLKTTVVHEMRCMTTWVVRKLAN